MQRLRSYYDADREIDFSIPTDYKVADNQNEIYCSMCGESFFVDDFIFEDVSRIIEETLENPFVCLECINDYEDLAYGQ